MHPKAIDRFFRTLARAFPEPVTVILTGAAAGSLFGHIRPSQDIDCGVRFTRSTPERWLRFKEAVDHTTVKTGIQVNYAPDIDRWSAITLLDYQRHTIPYRRFGTLQVRLLDPVYWSIGKMGRYFDLDVQDLVAVLKRRKTPLRALVRVWARALKVSPPSPALFQFHTQVEHFLRTYGRTIWGKTFNAEQAIQAFERHLKTRRT